MKKPVRDDGFNHYVTGYREVDLIVFIVLASTTAATAGYIAWSVIFH